MSFQKENRKHRFSSCEMSAVPAKISKSSCPTRQRLQKYRHHTPRSASRRSNQNPRSPVNITHQKTPLRPHKYPQTFIASIVNHLNHAKRPSTIMYTPSENKTQQEPCTKIVLMAIRRPKSPLLCQLLSSRSPQSSPLILWSWHPYRGMYMDERETW